MFLTKLNEMSIGPLWKLRQPVADVNAIAADSAQITQPTPNSGACAICNQDWMQLDNPNATVLAVVAAPMTDQTQRRLLENCLLAAGLDQHYSLLSLHGVCHENSQLGLDALSAQIANQNPAVVLVFGSAAAKLIQPEFAQLPSQLHPYGNCTIIVTHDPAEMLATPKLKARVWADLCLLKQALATSH